MCWYDEDGTLNAEVGCPIYECNPACFCLEECVNKVVQKGPRYPLEVKFFYLYLIRWSYLKQKKKDGE